MASSPPLVIANCIQVRLGSVAAGLGAYNVLHFIKAGTATIDQAAAEAIGAAAKTAWTANMAPLCAANSALVRVSVRDLTAPNLPEFSDTGAAALGVDTAAQPMPAGVALCITLRTAKSGKSFRGRVYLAGFSETQNGNEGNAEPAAVTGGTEFVSDFADAMDNLGYQLGVASRPANASQLIRRTGLPNGDIQEEILSSTTQKAGGIELVTVIQSRTTSWETQRKRQNGRGGNPALALAAATRTRPVR